MKKKNKKVCPKCGNEYLYKKRIGKTTEFIHKIEKIKAKETVVTEKCLRVDIQIIQLVMEGK